MLDIIFIIFILFLEYSYALKPPKIAQLSLSWFAKYLQIFKILNQQIQL